MLVSEGVSNCPIFSPKLTGHVHDTEESIAKNRVLPSFPSDVVIGVHSLHCILDVVIFLASAAQSTEEPGERSHLLSD